MASKVAKKSSKKEVFVVGQWVRITRGVSYAKKGTLAVVSSTVKRDSWSNEPYQYVVYGSDGNYSRQTEGTMVKIAAPEFVVAWSTPNNDPVEHFESLSAARAFRTKLLKRRGSQRAIESAIYKRVK